MVIALLLTACGSSNMNAPVNAVENYLNALVEKPMEALAGLGILALGIPFYWY